MLKRLLSRAQRGPLTRLAHLSVLLALGWLAAPAQAVQVTYYHTDGLGSVVMESNEAGQVTYSREYRPFGEQVIGAPKEGPGFTGHVADVDTGLTYMQQRYYDPGIGRFLSVDPVMADGAAGGNFNRYKYASNNPYKFTDPDGRLESPAWMRALIPGMATWDTAVTSAENGNYGTAVAQGAVAITEGVLGVLTLGESQAAVATGRTAVTAIQKVGAGEQVISHVNPKTLLSRQGPGEMSGSQVKRLANDMKASGFNPAKPIDAAKVDGRMVIINGHHRAAAAIKAGIKEVPVNTVPTTPQQGSQLLQEVAEATQMRSWP